MLPDEPADGEFEAVVTEDADTPVERDFEAEARKDGWKPETDFKGPKGRWKDAETYVRDREDNFATVKNMLDKERKEYADRISRVERTANVAFERTVKDYEGRIASLQAQVDNFARAGDAANYDRAKAMLTQAQNDAPQAPVQQTETPDAIFQRENTWYGEDLAMTAYAEKVSQRLAQRGGISLEDNLKQTADAVKKEFPHKFAKGETRRTFATVDAGSVFPSGSRRNGSQSYESLPSDVKAVADRYIAKGWFKDGNEYAKDYYAGMKK